MFGFQSTAQRLCLVLILLVLAALCLPTDPASAQPRPAAPVVSAVRGV